jgi:hypothetical protein
MNKRTITAIAAMITTLNLEPSNRLRFRTTKRMENSLNKLYVIVDFSLCSARTDQKIKTTKNFITLGAHSKG